MGAKIGDFLTVIIGSIGLFDVNSGQVEYTKAKPGTVELAESTKKPPDPFGVVNAFRSHLRQLFDLWMNTNLNSPIFKECARP